VHFKAGNGNPLSRLFFLRAASPLQEAVLAGAGTPRARAWGSQLCHWSASTLAPGRGTCSAGTGAGADAEVVSCSQWRSCRPGLSSEAWLETKAL